MLGFKRVGSKNYQERDKINKADTREFWEKNFVSIICRQYKNNFSSVQVLIINTYK